MEKNDLKEIVKSSGDLNKLNTEQAVEKELYINVYGYQDVKNELSRIKSWLENEEFLNNKNIMLPKGVLFYGKPGNGKTLMLRDFANSFDAPIFVIDGESTNLSGEITKTFKKAREEKFAIILIDEIDLLIGRSFQVERTLQQEIDGVNDKGRILVLATTNNFHEISAALLRPGRFDRLIKVDYPDKESRKELLRNFISKLGVSDKNVDYDHVSKICNRCSGSELKAVCNDAYLRSGGALTTDEIEKSYERIVNNDYSEDKSEFKDFRVAIHEAGHAIMAMHFKENWTFYTAKFVSNGGLTEIQEVSERTDTIAKREQNIMIGLGGYLAEETYFGKHEVGSWSDYCKAQEYCERLIERVCCQGIENLVTADYLEGDRHWTNRKILKNERKVKRILRKYVKNTRSYLKKHKTQLEQFAKIMYDNGKCSYKDTEHILNAL